VVIDVIAYVSLLNINYSVLITGSDNCILFFMFSVLREVILGAGNPCPALDVV